MARDLSRLLRPKSVCVVGGGAWCDAVIGQLTKVAFQGDIWQAHPTKPGAYRTIADLPTPPDATFIGVNRHVTIEIITALSKRKAGGAVCFASGFAEVADGNNDALLQAAGDMPILGPNCYGFINALDGALLWPDQHGCLPVDSGVAILTQSSNIAINLTMQVRGLPISYAITCGNQAQTTQADIAMSLLDDPRVTAIGLHVEGFGDPAKWEALSRKAHAQNIPLIAIKVGASSEAQAATISHTASLAGGDAGAQALLDRLGIARAHDLDSFIEALKILHMAGPLPSTQIATISCSGGETSLAADIAAPLGLTFPPLTPTQTANLTNALGPKVTLANPLDYHTYIWRDVAAMTDAFAAMHTPDLAIIALIVDFPRTDRCDPSDWECVIAAALQAKARTGGTYAMMSSLPELMPEPVAQRLMDGGVIPLSGLRCGLHAVALAQKQTPDTQIDLLPPQPEAHKQTLLTEVDAKAVLNTHGVPIPRGHAYTGTCNLTFPVVLKGEGIAHKTEANAVHLNIQNARDLATAATQMPTKTFFVEEMITDTVAELLVGVLHDPAHGFVLTIGAGGTLTELIADTQSLLLPTTTEAITTALANLKIHPILQGYRGQPPANTPAICDAILAIQNYVTTNAATVTEVEVNPLICTPTRAIAADALIRNRQ